MPHRKPRVPAVPTNTEMFQTQPPCEGIAVHMLTAENRDNESETNQENETIHTIRRKMDMVPVLTHIKTIYFVPISFSKEMSPIFT